MHKNTHYVCNIIFVSTSNLIIVYTMCVHDDDDADDD